ncbi:hypothetical protein IGI04_019599 [Brassica rapa subsp. trilocularis]|uniref:Metallo-beta-lactamase domain-containing protein n=1 Tax=Brassica rapa subsp. trilocularis TaxID=1813537 RepID=A0ABQ7MGA5_BRACM|nr:hypothetical protein IGI04_019599 [Brassica rapa subsp. trilocularis]
MELCRPPFDVLKARVLVVTTSSLALLFFTETPVTPPELLFFTDPPPELLIFLEPPPELLFFTDLPLHVGACLLHRSTTACRNFSSSPSYHRLPELLFFTDLPPHTRASLLHRETTGASLLPQATTGSTPLHRATTVASLPHRDTTRAYLLHPATTGASLPQRVTTGATPLHRATTGATPLLVRDRIGRAMVTDHCLLILHSHFDHMGAADSTTFDDLSSHKVAIEDFRLPAFLPMVNKEASGP